MAHHGFDNYPTSVVALWLTRDEAAAKHWRRRAQLCFDRLTVGRFEQARQTVEREFCHSFGKELQETIHAGQLEPATGIYAELLGFALAEVNWSQVAVRCLEAPDEG